MSSISDHSLVTYSFDKPKQKKKEKEPNEINELIMTFHEFQ